MHGDILTKDQTNITIAFILKAILLFTARGVNNNIEREINAITIITHFDIHNKQICITKYS